MSKLELPPLKAGDTFIEEGDDYWTAGIHVGDHGNAIECYRSTEDEANALRDFILEALSVAQKRGGYTRPAQPGTPNDHRGDQVMSIVGLLNALADDCDETDGWEDAAPTVRKAAAIIEELVETGGTMLNAAERHIFGDECQDERRAFRTALTKATGKAA